MKKIIFTRPDEGGLSVIIPAAKEDIERSLGRCSDYHIDAMRAGIQSWRESFSPAGAMIASALGSLNLTTLNINDSDEKILNDFLDTKPKDKLPLTQEEYEAHVREKSIPDGALNIREIDESDIPNTREFRSAWCDVTSESIIDIDLSKAKNIKLTQMRDNRQKRFEELGFPVRLNPELEVALISQETRDKLQSLRDCTEPLKALGAEGYNDEAVLQQIRELGTLNDV
jgi:hypothetical protein